MHYFNEILSHTKSKSNHQAPKFPLVLLYTFHQFLISLEESYTRTRLKVFILWMVFVEYSQCWLFNTIKYSTLHIKDFSSKCDQFRKKLRIWLHLLEKSLMKNLIFNHQFNFSLCFLCKKTDLKIKGSKDLLRSLFCDARRHSSI